MARGNWGALVGALLVSVVVSVTGAAAVHATNQGQVGPRGPQGLTGNSGPAGADGLAGTAGATGPRGMRGLTGPAGTTTSGVATGPSVTYHAVITDLEDSFVQIPTSDISVSGPLASSDLAGRAPLYDVHNTKVGTCSASFVTMQTNDGIFTDIASNLSATGGLIVSWSTPTQPANLQLGSLVNAMAAESTVTVTTKIGASIFFGKKFDLVVSTDSTNIYFKFTPIS